MRIKLVGKSDVDRIEMALARLVELQPEGVSWHGVNIYLTLKNEAGEEIELGLNGEEVGMIAFPDPVKPKRVPAKKKTLQLAQVIPFRRDA
jgi:hypothetical protein